jgi:Domain of unknown function (DUF4349)
MRFPARTDRRTGSIVRILRLAAVAVILAACAGSAAQAPRAAGAAAVGGPAQAAASAAGGISGGNQSVGGGGSQTGGNGDPAALVDDTKIVRTGSLQLTVADTDKAVLAARDGVRALGGYIGASQQQRSGDSIVATVTYRIPVTRWEDALDAIRHLGTEVAEQTDATEVTGQLVDLDARIRNLKASETALVGYAAQAPKTSDLLEIEARLTDTRGEIERLSAQQATLSDQAAMATLTVTFGTEVVAVDQAAAKWDPAAEVDRASATLIGVGQAVASFLILFAIVWLPILVGLAIVAFVGLAIARRLGWRRPGGFPPIDATPPPAPAAPVSEA